MATTSGGFDPSTTEIFTIYSFLWLCRRICDYIGDRQASRCAGNKIQQTFQDWVSMGAPRSCWLEAIISVPLGEHRYKMLDHSPCSKSYGQAFKIL